MGYFIDPTHDPDLEIYRKETIEYGENYSFNNQYQNRLKNLQWDERGKVIDEIYKEIESSDEKPSWWNPDMTHGRYKDVREMDGCVIIMSDGDNQIPYDQFDRIEYAFHAQRFHLG
jgi:hypothetical protein